MSRWDWHLNREYCRPLHHCGKKNYPDEWSHELSVPSFSKEVGTKKKGATFSWWNRKRMNYRSNFVYKFSENSWSIIDRSIDSTSMWSGQNYSQESCAILHSLENRRWQVEGGFLIFIYYYTSRKAKMLEGFELNRALTGSKMSSNFL